MDYYYEMSERIPEDFELRQRLAMRRLEEVLYKFIINFIF